MKKTKVNQKPLTLEILADYNQKVFFPALDEHFTTKKDFNEFRDKVLTNGDKMLKKLDALLTEKKVREYREEKENIKIPRSDLGIMGLDKVFEKSKL